MPEPILQTPPGESAWPLAPRAPVESRLSDASAFAALEQRAQLFPLPWSHYVKLLAVRNDDARRFYEIEALRGGWSVRQLDRQISSPFYERTLLSTDKSAMLRKTGAG